VALHKEAKEMCCLFGNRRLRIPPAGTLKDSRQCGSKPPPLLFAEERPATVAFFHPVNEASCFLQGNRFSRVLSASVRDGGGAGGLEWAHRDKHWRRMNPWNTKPRRAHTRILPMFADA